MVFSDQTFLIVYLICKITYFVWWILLKLFQNQSLYDPTNAHNIKNAELLKHIKIMEAAPTCFGLQRNHHQGATAIA
jgi:hypothetical protein